MKLTLTINSIEVVLEGTPNEMIEVIEHLNNKQEVEDDKFKDWSDWDAAWLRGESRRIWANYPLRNEYKSSQLEPVAPHHGITNTRVKKIGKCNQCKGLFAASNLEVDHITPAGSFTNWNEWLVWMTRLLCYRDWETTPYIDYTYQSLTREIGRAHV